MKKLLIATAIFFVSFAFGNEIPKFPEYSKSMDLGYDCSASCTFSSCSGVGTCSCSCSWFSCDCQPSNPKDKGPKMFEQLAFASKDVHTSDISMNEKQYERTKAFAAMLASIGKDDTNKVYVSLVKMIDSLKNKNDDDFNTYRKEYFNNLKNVSNVNREFINNFFSNLGAVERI